METWLTAYSSSLPIIWLLFKAKLSAGVLSQRWQHPPGPCSRSQVCVRGPAPLQASPCGASATAQCNSLPLSPLVSKRISGGIELPGLGGEQVGLWGALCQSDGALQAPSPWGLTSQTAKQNTARGSQLHRQSKATRNFRSYLHS